MHLIDQWRIHDVAAATLSSPRPDFVRWHDCAGSLLISRAPSADGFTLHHATEIAVEVHDNGGISVCARPGVPQHTIDHFLRDQVAPRVLAHEGRLVLHAGGIRSGDGAFLLLGTTGRGKSTLSASFERAGWPLLGDDAMVIEGSDEPTVRAVYPSLRLLPDSIAALFDDDVARSPVAHYSDKQRIDMPDADEAPPLPVRALFLLDEPAADDAISIVKVGPAETCAAILANSFALDPADLDQAAERMARAAALTEAVPAFSLSYPRDYARLADVRAAILATLAPVTPA